MSRKYSKRFAICVALIPIFISLSLPILLYLWARGWFGEVSTLSPVFAYVGLGLSLLLMIGAVVAGVIVTVIWFKHRDDKEPVELLIEAMNKRFNKIDSTLSNIEKHLNESTNTSSEK